jgi:hypothetical protein
VDFLQLGKTKRRRIEVSGLTTVVEGTSAVDIRLFIGNYITVVLL